MSDLAIASSKDAELMAALKEEVWFDTEVGYDDLVIPGFSPLSVEGTTIKLGAGREYRWANTLFPYALTHKDREVAGPLALRLVIGGKVINLKAETVVIKESTPTKVVVEAKSQYQQALDLVVTTTVEYDGVAMVSIELTPKKAISIDSLSFVATINRNPYTSIMGFKARTVRGRVKELLFPFSYRGEFINAIGFPNGEHSFWWFADNAKGWIWNSDAVTEINSTDDKVTFKQNLIGSNYVVNKPMNFSFNYLLTPVRELVDERRSKHLARVVSKEEAKYSDRKIWWTTAFSHQDLPYTDYPPGTKSKLPAKDIELYPGLLENRRLLAKWRKVGIERIPYFSAHVLSGIDPMLLKYRSLWEVEPPFVIPPKSDRPYTAKIAKPWLLQSAPGYTDYLIYHFDQTIKQLGYEGLYFDQGGVIQSANPNHGLWIDSNGNKQPSMDIMGLRNFFKRLATIFEVNDKKGYIYVHNSMVPVIPAYTFATHLVQGEEYIRYLKNLNYSTSSNIDEVRSKFSPNQYGIDSVWLSELWNHRVEGGKPRSQPMPSWQASDRYKEGLRGFFGLSLIHDAEVWVVTPLSLRRNFYKPLDSFGLGESIFHGYWDEKSLKIKDGFYVSFFEHKREKKVLIVFFNKSEKVVELSSGDIIKQSKMINGAEILSMNTFSDNGDPVAVSADIVNVKPNNFYLVETIFK
ncbi:MAG: glycoside hydrolase domain-containing protein [Pseudomonadales bacterium]